VNRKVHGGKPRPTGAAVPRGEKKIAFPANWNNFLLPSQEINILFLKTAVSCCQTYTSKYYCNKLDLWFIMY
jgi:hypothetical protein